jgi:hypothetical protein
MFLFQDQAWPTSPEDKTVTHQNPYIRASFQLMKCVLMRLYTPVFPCFPHKQVFGFDHARKFTNHGSK